MFDWMNLESFDRRGFNFSPDIRIIDHHAVSIVGYNFSVHYDLAASIIEFLQSQHGMRVESSQVIVPNLGKASSFHPDSASEQKEVTGSNESDNRRFRYKMRCLAETSTILTLRSL